MKARSIVGNVLKRHRIDAAIFFGPSRGASAVRARRDAISELRDAGYSVLRIARIIKRDETTVGYHLYPNVAARRKARRSSQLAQMRAAR